MRVRSGIETAVNPVMLGLGSCENGAKTGLA